MIFSANKIILLFSSQVLIVRYHSGVLKTLIFFFSVVYIKVPEQNGAKNGKFDDINLEMSASASLDNLANSSAREALPSEKPSKKKSVKKSQKAINLADLAAYVKTKKSSRKDTLAQEYEVCSETSFVKIISNKIFLFCLL